jgi:inner membrane protein
MPSPIGHALAGAAIAWGLSRPVGWKPVALCAAFAALPDIDLVYLPVHRTATHSIPMAILITIISVAVTGWVRATSKTPSTRIGWVADPYLGLACGLAWSSHIPLDWLGADASAPYGVQALWPFSDRWFVSGWDLFPGTERRQPFAVRALLINLRAAIREIALMGSVLLAVMALRAGFTRIRKSRGPTFVPDDPPRPSGAAGDTAGTSDRRSRRAAR